DPVAELSIRRRTTPPHPAFGARRASHPAVPFFRRASSSSTGRCQLPSRVSVGDALAWRYFASALRFPARVHAGRLRGLLRKRLLLARRRGRSGPPVRLLPRLAAGLRLVAGAGLPRLGGLRRGGLRGVSSEERRVGDECRTRWSVKQ